MHLFNGKGSSRLAARASAYGELFERLSTHMSFSDYYLGLDNSNAPYVHFKDENGLSSIRMIRKFQAMY